MPLEPLTGSEDPRAEAERLRAMLDRQPTCLMRIALDGTLLAVSDTALDLLGARELAQVLGASFVDWLRGEAAGVWSEFAHRVAEGGSGSAEGEMADLAGARRNVILLGVSLPHPDGTPSLLVTVRDMTTARRLEASLQEQEGVRRSLQATLDQATAALDRLTAALTAALEAASHARQALDKRWHE